MKRESVGDSHGKETPLKKLFDVPFDHHADIQEQRIMNSGVFSV
jgi:hypothetical protein